MNCGKEKRREQECGFGGYGFIVLVLFILLAIILGAGFIH